MSENSHEDDKQRKKSEKKKSEFFKRMIKWLIKPKSLNATICYIFTIAALLPISCWAIIGVDGLVAGSVTGIAFAFIGIVFSMVFMDG